MSATPLRRTEKLSTATTLADVFEDVCTMDAPLNERLAAYADALRAMNFPFAEAYDELFARLYAGDVGTRSCTSARPLSVSTGAIGVLSARSNSKQLRAITRKLPPLVLN
jgi:hypothetical protein